MQRPSAKAKLLLTLSVILVLSFLAVSLINYKVSRQSARDEILKSSLPLTGENIYSDIHADLMRPIFISSLMANDTFLKDWAMDGERDLAKVQKYLNEIKTKYDFFTSFFVSAKTHNYYYFGGVLKQVARQNSHDAWYYDFANSGLEYDLDVDTNQAANNRLTIFINYRVEDHDGNLLGVAGVGLEMDRVAELLRLYQKKYNRSISMVGPRGVIQTHADTSRIQSGSIRDMEGIGALADNILQPIPEPRQFEYDRNGSHILLSVRYIPEFDWYLLVEQNEAPVLASARANLLRTLAIGLAVSLIIIFVSTITVNHYQSRLERMAGTDELTGLANRREFETEFARAKHRCQRYELPLTMALMDLDNLKAVNDRCGHLEGDRALQATAEAIRHTVRGGDLVARWGGDEFVLLMDGGPAEALAVTERVRRAVAETVIPGPSCRGEQPPVLTISCGLAAFRDGDDLPDLTARADEALYKAKAGGRNRVESV